MARKSSEKPKIPAVNWTRTLVWNLINLARLPENTNVLLGKNKDDKTTADNKTKVYKRIAEALLPAVFAIDPESAANRTSSKWDDLKKKYREHAAKLYQTGGGLRQDEANPTPHEYSDCYIKAGGPDETTTSTAKNLWDQITSEFVFFQELHRLLCTRPSSCPPALTTGPVDDPIPIDPAFKDIVYSCPPLQLHGSQPVPPPPSSFQPDEAHPLESLAPAKENIPPPPKNPGVGSEKLEEAMRKARENSKPLGPKRQASGVEDMFSQISRRSYKLNEKRFKQDAVRFAEEANQKRHRLEIEECQLILAEREALLAERNAGLISDKEYRILRRLDGNTKHMQKPQSPHRSSTPLTDDPACHSSPDWDYSQLDGDMTGPSSDGFEIDGEP